MIFILRMRVRMLRLRCASFRAAAPLAVVLAAFLTHSVANATPLDPNGSDWEGLSDFLALSREELGRDRVVVTQKLDLASLHRTDALVLIHPERAIDADELSAFMRQGGRIVLLDDYGTGDGLASYFGIRRVPLPRRPAKMLRGNPALAIAEATGKHASFRDIEQVVTNHATGLAHASLSPLLVVRGDGEADVLLALAGSVGAGNLLALGDSSVAMNSMLRYPGNRALALALVRYAMQPASAEPGGKLYVLANDFEMTGWFDPQHAGGVFGQAYTGLTGALRGLRQNGMPPTASYVLAIVVGLGVLYWATTRAGRMHKPTQPRFVRRVPLAAQGGVAGHAAAVGAPGAPRAAVMLELKSALEEQLATRLGFERTPPYDELLAKARSSGLLTDEDARSLARLLAGLGRVEAMLSAHRRGAVEQIRDADIVAVAARVRALLGAVEARRRDKVTGPP